MTPNDPHSPTGARPGTKARRAAEPYQQGRDHGNTQGLAYDHEPTVAFGDDFEAPQQARAPQHDDDEPTLSLGGRFPNGHEPAPEQFGSSAQNAAGPGADATSGDEELAWLNTPTTGALHPDAAPAPDPHNANRSAPHGGPPEPLEAWEQPPEGVVAMAPLEAQREHFGRLQVFPGLMGWMVALSALSFFTWLAETIMALPTGTLTHPIAETLQRFSEGEADALTFLITVGVIYLLAYLAGGYTAGRMARFAGAKQGVSVCLWQILGCATATIFTYVMPHAFSPGSYSPLAAQQFFGAGTISNGILALLSVIGVSFLGAILGGMCGRIYHRRVEKYPK